MFHGACTKDARDSVVTEPPNTEVLLATVREALREYTARLRDPVPEKRALVALDAIASELARLTTERQEQVRLSGERAALLTRYSQRAEAAEAELKRVRVERDEEIEGLRYGYRDSQARLDRAVEALRVIAESELIDSLAHYEATAGWEAAAEIARAALAEIEESG